MPYVSGRDRDQISLIPLSLDDQVSRTSDVRVIDDFVSGWDLSALGFDRSGAPPDGMGAPAYPAGAMIRLLLYGYYYRLRSSRRLEWLCATNVEVQWLMHGLTPSHATICTFVRENGPAFHDLFRSFVLFLKYADLADGALVAVDGTKIKADAARDMVTPEILTKRIARADAEIAEYTKALQDDDDTHPDGGLRARMESAGGREVMQQDIAALQAHRGKQQAMADTMKEAQKGRMSPGDPEALLMRTRQGKTPAYNLQLAVDAKHKLIIDQELVCDQNDVHQLETRVGSLAKVFGPVTTMLFDCGYYSSPQIAALYEQRPVVETASDRHVPEVLVSLPRTIGASTKGFTYDAEHNRYVCSQKRELPLISRNVLQHGKHYDIYKSRDCEGCPIRSSCTKSVTGRTIKRNVDEHLLAIHHERVRSTEGKDLLRQRKKIVEHVGGNLKSILGPSFLTRGPTRVAVEATLASIAYDLKRLTKLWTTDVAALLSRYKTHMIAAT